MWQCEALEHNRVKNAKAMPTRFSLYTRTLHTFVPQFIRNAVSSATLDASSRETYESISTLVISFFRGIIRVIPFRVSRKKK